jgi:hemolysin D
VIEALEQYENAMTQDAGDRGQLIETDAAMRSLERKIDEVVTQFVADQSQKLAEAEHKRDRAEQELIKAQSKSDRTQLKAPIAGTVQQLAVASIGQVVTSGQPLLTLVPLDASIEVEAMIANKDIGFVASGQRAIVKVEAFPFTRYGTIEASVAKVSRDAVDERDATNLSDASNAAKAQQDASTQPSRTQNLVFPATIRLVRNSIEIDGREVALTPGMAVTVEIKTGQRRVIDYLLSPLREVAAQSLSR